MISDAAIGSFVNVTCANDAARMLVLSDLPLSAASSASAAVSAADLSLLMKLFASIWPLSSPSMVVGCAEMNDCVAYRKRLPPAWRCSYGAGVSLGLRVATAGPGG